ncbi:MAG: DNA polymerase III subunit gamma/tau, partial [Candidatus Neomarinimicrobiota bacterium]
MSYTVLSLKWRPRSFAEMVGQDAITRTLRNAFQQNRVAQAYLFTGPRGVGKTTTARIVAKALNCPESPGNPCNECSTCREIDESRNIDVLEIDGASNRGIEEIRNLRELIKYAPVNSPYKVFIIDEVHMFTGPAFNALLRTLEEPPAHGKFILATTDVHKVPATIISRCQRFDFNRIAPATIQDRISAILEAEHIKIDVPSLELISHKADGSMRDALSILDQVIAYSGEAIHIEATREVLGIVPVDQYFAVSAAIRAKDGAALVEQIRAARRKGISAEVFVQDIETHFHHLLIAGFEGGATLIDHGEEIQKRYEEESRQWDRRDLLRIGQQLSELRIRVGRIESAYLLIEMWLLKLTEMDRSVAIEELIQTLGGARNRPPAVKPTQTPAPAPRQEPTPSPRKPQPKKPKEAGDLFTPPSAAPETPTVQEPTPTREPAGDSDRKP